VHFGLVGIDALLVEKPILMDFDNRFLRSAFSFPFLPILLMEMALTTLTLSLWVRLRRALEQAHTSDLQREQQAATVRTLQQVMAVLAQHVARENNQILEAVAARRQRGQQTSEAIEAPSRRIAEILHALSELSFVAPYLDRPEGQALDLLQELERRMRTGEADGT
jgi:cell division septum initiation protein DivIVA